MKHPLALLALSILFSRTGASAEPDWPHAEDHAVQVLQRYVRIQSVNPPADTSATANLLQSEFQSYGMQAQLFRNGSGGKTCLLVRLPGKDHSKRPLLLLNHMDVVPVDASRWKHNPFGAQI